MGQGWKDGIEDRRQKHQEVIEELSRLTKAVETLIPQRSPAPPCPPDAKFSYSGGSVQLEDELAERYLDLLTTHVERLAWEDKNEVDGRIEITRQHLKAAAILAAKDIVPEPGVTQ